MLSENERSSCSLSQQHKSHSTLHNLFILLPLAFLSLLNYRLANWLDPPARARTKQNFGRRINLIQFWELANRPMPCQTQPSDKESLSVEISKAIRQLSRLRWELLVDCFASENCFSRAPRRAARKRLLMMKEIRSDGRKVFHFPSSPGRFLHFRMQKFFFPSLKASYHLKAESKINNDL